MTSYDVGTRSKLCRHKVSKIQCHPWQLCKHTKNCMEHLVNGTLSTSHPWQMPMLLVLNTTFTRFWQFEIKLSWVTFNLQQTKSILPNMSYPPPSSSWDKVSARQSINISTNTNMHLCMTAKISVFLKTTNRQQQVWIVKGELILLN